MNKITSLLILGLLMLNVNLSIAATVDTKSTSSYDAAVREYDFENNSYNISDEQLQIEPGTDLIEQDRKASFWSKLINSSHFSSKTATKTWIPINKEE